MTRMTTKLMVAAAAFVAVAGVASAQTMEANIPFAFRASGKVMAPGTYRVTMNGASSAPIFRIHEKYTGDSVLGVAVASADPKAAWVKAGDPVLSFQCGVGRCSLTQVYSGADHAYRLSAPGLGKDEPRKTAEIVMHPVAD